MRTVKNICALWKIYALVAKFVKRSQKFGTLETKIGELEPKFSENDCI